ncbi:hypothetical protein TSOC_007341 [Tetrabaena socialis]|uniref:Uncharacterized protein n=1 Tax=Tetrabaena socialis TaxID=47790 RepID=A0A2J8A1D7_9CHLO|nr:hypothetical protein TSOC_007341 [Tetrabaena socialis]|eukprot:PNH06337.1 hypothetical protein TSOC_007341 [Tetrabaena socialis]
MSGPVMHAYMQFLELAQRLLGRSEGAEAKFDTLINLASALNGKFDMLAGILEKLVADKTAVDPLLKELEAIHAMVVDLKLQTALASGCNIEDILKSAKVGDVPVSSEAITAYMEGRRADNSGAGRQQRRRTVDAGHPPPRGECSGPTALTPAADVAMAAPAGTPRLTPGICPIKATFNYNKVGAMRNFHFHVASSE